MVVIRALPLGLLAALFIGAPAFAAPDCQTEAQALLKTVEARPMTQRAALILEALEDNEALGCGIVPASHWLKDAALPQGCSLKAFKTCDVPQGVPVAQQVQVDVEPQLYLRVQSAAIQLAATGNLRRPIKRLLQLLLLSNAIQRGG